MKPYLKILPMEQKKIYPHLKAIKDLGFTLFGGTAIALQLGHRVSVDFDFFTDKDISDMHEVLLNLENIIVDDVTQQKPNTLTFTTQDGVKFSFFGNIPFVALADKVQTDDGILELAGLKALLITKLKSTCDRAEYKDYKDIIEILKAKQVSLEEGLEGVPDYFGNKFPTINIIKGLTYFEDGDLYKLSDEEKQFLCKQVRNLNLSVC